METLKKNISTILIVVILLAIFWYFFLRKNPRSGKMIVGHRQTQPMYYVANGPVTVMFDKAREKATLSLVSQSLSQLGAQFNSTGCAANNVINSNATLNELRSQVNAIQDLNTRTLVNTFVLSYPSLIADCTATGNTTKSTMIAALQAQLTTYNSSIV